MQGCYSFFCGSREEGGEGGGESGAMVKLLIKPFSMAFHGVPFLWSRNARRETVPVSVFLLSHVFQLGTSERPNLDLAKFTLSTDQIICNVVPFY